jgi:hypothetical protein
MSAYRTARVIQITFGKRANTETAHGRIPAGVIKAHCPTAVPLFPGNINRVRIKSRKYYEYFVKG